MLKHGLRALRTRSILTQERKRRRSKEPTPNVTPDTVSEFMDDDLSDSPSEFNSHDSSNGAEESSMGADGSPVSKGIPSNTDLIQRLKSELIQSDLAQRHDGFKKRLEWLEARIASLERQNASLIEENRLVRESARMASVELSKRVSAEAAESAMALEDPIGLLDSAKSSKGNQMREGHLITERVGSYETGSGEPFYAPAPSGSSSEKDFESLVVAVESLLGWSVVATDKTATLLWTGSKDFLDLQCESVRLQFQLADTSASQAPEWVLVETDDDAFLSALKRESTAFEWLRDDALKSIPGFVGHVTEFLLAMHATGSSTAVASSSVQ